MAFACQWDRAHLTISPFDVSVHPTNLNSSSKRKYRFVSLSLTEIVANCLFLLCSSKQGIKVDVADHIYIMHQERLFAIKEPSGFQDGAAGIKQFIGFIGNCDITSPEMDSFPGIR